MPGKEQLKKKLAEAQREIDGIAKEIAEAETTAYRRKCHYRKCSKEFTTDDGRRYYCCQEHYLAENRERTREKNALRVSTKVLDTQ